MAHSPAFAYVTEWSVALNKLKDEFRIIEFAPQQVIRMDRLNKFGVDRTSLMAFCAAVYDYTEPGEYFTIQSIRKDGFESSLFNLGFKDWFYSSILREDNRFGFRRMGEGKPIIVFCRDVPKVTRRSFITYILDALSDMNPSIRVVPVLPVAAGRAAFIFFEDIVKIGNGIADFMGDFNDGFAGGPQQSLCFVKAYSGQVIIGRQACVTLEVFLKMVFVDGEILRK